MLCPGTYHPYPGHRRKDSTHLGRGTNFLEMKGKKSRGMKAIRRSAWRKDTGLWAASLVNPRGRQPQKAIQVCILGTTKRPDLRNHRAETPHGPSRCHPSSC